MLVAETVLGNFEDDAEWASRYDDRPDEEIERVVLDDRDRRRSRVRTTTNAGTDIGIVVEGNRRLQPGDVLVADDDRFVVVAFEDRPALVIAFEGNNMSTADAVQLASLGYQVGNRHWDLAVRDEEVLVALGTDAEQKVAEVTDALPAGAETRRETVDPTLFDDDGFGSNTDHTHGAGTGDHTHGPESGGHTHGSDSDGHTHSHGDQGGHTHGDRNSTYEGKNMETYENTWFRTVSTEGEDSDD